MLYYSYNLNILNRFMNSYSFDSTNNDTIIFWWINTAKEFIAHEIARKFDIPLDQIIHGDKLRVDLYQSLSDSDRKKYFPKMYQLFDEGRKGIDVINALGIDEYLRQEFEESKFVYKEALQWKINQNINSSHNIFVWVQLLPELLEQDIISRNDIWVIWAFRDDIQDLYKREQAYRDINHNHNNYVYSYMNAPIDISKLPSEDIEKLKQLSTDLGIPISAYLLHFLAKIEYSKALKKKLSGTQLEWNISVIDAAETFEQAVFDILK